MSGFVFGFVSGSCLVSSGFVSGSYLDRIYKNGIILISSACFCCLVIWSFSVFLHDSLLYD